MKRVLLLMVKCYKIFVSPILVPLGFSGCRFRPTCSSYAFSAIKKYGSSKGVILTVKRLSRCQPYL